MMNSVLRRPVQNSPRLMPAKAPERFERSAALTPAERSCYPEVSAAFNRGKTSAPSPELGDLAGVLAALGAPGRRPLGDVKSLLKGFLLYRLRDANAAPEIGRKIEQALGHADRAMGRIRNEGYDQTLQFYATHSWADIVSADYDLDMAEMREPASASAKPNPALEI